MKNKINRKASLFLILIGSFLYVGNKVSAQFSVPAYGPPQVTRGFFLKIGILIVLLLSFVIGIIVFAAKKIRNKRNAENVSKNNEELKQVVLSENNKINEDNQISNQNENQKN